MSVKTEFNIWKKETIIVLSHNKGRRGNLTSLEFIFVYITGANQNKTKSNKFS
ncbi:Uncharacterised protein [Elizabethkingia meningoseptica]|nr:Uncharacterised protein [Elizabethkingia meningoseptica]